MTTIGIIGAGIGGLHLALYLQQQGVPVTLYAERAPDEVRAMRLPNTQGLMAEGRVRHEALGVSHWDSPDRDLTAVRFRIAGEHPIGFTGALVPPHMFIDMRLYLPRLMEDFAARGGTVVLGACRPGDVARLGEVHDLVVVATGRDGLAAMFSRLPEHSPYDRPQRLLLGGLFRGIHVPVPRVLGYDILPGAGEIIEMPILSRDGIVAGLLVEAIPGGPLEPLTRLRYEDDPRLFDAAMLATVREHLPDAWARTDPATFGLTGPLDALAGAVTPTVRRGYVPLPGGRFAMGIGDTQVTFDPSSGQGAQAASRSAEILGALVAARAYEGGRFDEAFCADAEQKMWERNRAASEWGNALLQPPPPHVIGLFVAAAQNKAIADAFANNFAHPDAQWAIVSSPEATAAFIAGFGAA
jgi:hypothetical protein